MGAPDSPVRQPRHPTARVRPLELWQVGPPDSPVVHRTVTVHCPVRLLVLLWLCAFYPRTVHLSVDRWSRPLRLEAIAPLAHRTVRWIIAEWHFQKLEGGEFELIYPGAPDTVRWGTRHCPVAHRTVRCARPGQPSVFFCSFLLNPILDFLLVCVEPLAPVELII
jgi:hypothetical protein